MKINLGFCRLGVQPIDTRLPCWPFHKYSEFVFFSIEAAADTSAKDAHLTADLECHLGLVPHQVSNSVA